MAEAQAAVNQVSVVAGAAAVGAGVAAVRPVPGPAYHAYTAGQTVTYNGHTYRCLQSHTSLPGWEPPNVPALWQFVS